MIVYLKITLNWCEADLSNDTLKKNLFRVRTLTTVLFDDLSNYEMNI